MPYISQKRRTAIDQYGHQPLFPGELNYLITKICLQYTTAKGDSYSTYNDIIGALECAKLELYRRCVAEYEDGKRTENGDVF